MPSRPNILFLMTDQMQGARAGSETTPARRRTSTDWPAWGMRFRRAYTPNAVCSPARASIMTGLLPHNHGVLEVTHCVDDDQCSLRARKSALGAAAAEAGYRTGYFGKWHVERFRELQRFGWQIDGHRDTTPSSRSTGETGAAGGASRMAPAA